MKIVRGCENVEKLSSFVLMNVDCEQRRWNCLAEKPNKMLKFWITFLI